MVTLPSTPVKVQSHEMGRDAAELRFRSVDSGAIHSPALLRSQRATTGRLIGSPNSAAARRIPDAGAEKDAFMPDRQNP